ncbi:MAG TPA: LytR C-terminal domain-containing protein, partial [Solirubrobacteraceae bacterium]|nr:LytR C-terminal domain-containing protein [Solirubrobacteraceae bacterium]
AAAQTTAGSAPSRRLAEMPPGAQAAAGTTATELADDKVAEPAANGNLPAAPAPGVPATGNGAAPPADGEATEQDADAPDPEAPAAVAAGETATAPPEDVEGAGAEEGDTSSTVVPAGPSEPDESRAAAGAEDPGSDATAKVEPEAARSVARAAADESAAPERTVAARPGDEAPPVPRITPAQRVGVMPRPAPMPLRQSQPSATAAGRGTPRRPPTQPARRPAAAPAPRQGRSAGTIALFVGIAVLILGGGTFAVSQLTGDDSPPAPNRAAPAQGEPDTTTEGTGRPVTPAAETNVAVLNGTTFTGLAGQLADRIAQEGGYKRGATETNTRDQTLQSSTVFYADGFRSQARKVAELLSIDALEPIDEDTQSLAPEADVVVLAGADQAP